MFIYNWIASYPGQGAWFGSMWLVCVKEPPPAPTPTPVGLEKVVEKLFWISDPISLFSSFKPQLLWHWNERQGREGKKKANILPIGHKHSLNLLVFAASLGYRIMGGKVEYSMMYIFLSWKFPLIVGKYFY